MKYRNKGLAVIALLLLQGCEQPKLRYQIEENATQQYYARAIIDLKSDRGTRTRTKNLVLTTQLQTQNISTADQPKLKLTFNDLLFETEPSRRTDFSSFQATTDKQQALIDYIKAGFVLTQAAESSFSTKSQSDKPLDAKTWMPNNEITERMKMYDLVALLPPQLDLKLGAKAQAKQGIFQLDYEVSALTDDKVTLNYSGVALQTEENPTADRLVGWAEYDIETGALLDGRVLFRFDFEERYVDGEVEMLIAVHRHFNSLPMAKPFFPDEDQQVHPIEPDFWPLLAKERGKIEQQKASSAAVKPNIYLSDISDEEYPITPLFLQIYATPNHSPYNIVSATIKDASSEGQPLSAYMAAPLMNNGFEYDRDNKNWFRQLILHPSQSVEKGLVNLELAVYDKSEIEQFSVPIGKEASHYQGDNYHIEVTPVSDNTWQFHFKFPYDALSELYSPLYKFGFVAKSNEIDSMRQIYGRHDPEFSLDGASKVRLHQLNLQRHETTEVTFASAPQGKFDMYVVQLDSSKVEYNLATESFTTSSSQQQPEERLVERQIPLAKLVELAPRVSVRSNSARLHVPEAIDADCQIIDIADDETGSLEWRLNGWDLTADRYREMRYHLVGERTSYFYDMTRGVEILCPEYQITDVKLAQDYTQSAPWLVTLQGELATLPAELMLKQLKAYNADGDELQWIEPVSGADFAYPTLKAWGNIAKVVRVSPTGEIKRYSETMTFEPKQ